MVTASVVPFVAPREPLAVALHRLAAKAHAEGLVILDDVGAAPFACRVTSSRPGHAPYIVNLMPGPLHGCQCQGYTNVQRCKHYASVPGSGRLAARSAGRSATGGANPPLPAAARGPSRVGRGRPCRARSVPASGAAGGCGGRVMSNLFDRSRIIPYKPELRFLSNGGSERVPSCWSPPRLRILADERERWVQEAADTLLADPHIHICAVSAAAAVPIPEIGRHSGEATGVAYPHFVITVIYQERVKPPAEPDVASVDTKQRELAASPS